MEHLMAWCAKQWPDDADVAIANASKIMDFAREYPDMVERHTYREVLDIIERNEREGIGR